MTGDERTNEGQRVAGPTRGIPRRVLLGGGVAVFAAAAAAIVASRIGDDQGGRRALRWKGVNVDTDRTVWRLDYVRNEMRVISRDLHANAVLLLGHDEQRLLEAASAAAEEGLAVWLEPRQFDSGPDDTLAFVTSVASEVEKLRADGADVGLSVGVELTLFLKGLIPGDGWLERGRALSTADAAEYNRRLNAFLADAVDALRPVFGGQLTYSSGQWERVDWTPFDIVGVDLYRNATNRATYVSDLRGYLGHDKPVFITEFGCCTFDGAAELGGDGFMESMDGDVSDLVRDEEEQATEVAELLDLYAAEGVDGAFVFNFIEPDNTYSSEPLSDLDKTGFSLVKCLGPDDERSYRRTGHFEPKRSYHAVARRYGGTT